MHVVNDRRRRHRIVLLGGDHPRSPHTRTLVEETAQALESAGAEPLDWSAETAPGGDLVEALRVASAVVLATPLIHNSYSGELKSMLDGLEPRQLQGLPVGLMATSSNGEDRQALDHLRTVVRSLDGQAVPGQVVATIADFALAGSERACGGAALRTQISEFIRELLWFTERFRERRQASAAASGARATRVVPFPAGGGGAGSSGTDTAASDVQPGSPGAALADTTSKGIALAIAHIRANYADSDLSLNDAADVACMSRYHFSRTFKAQTGERYIDLVTRLRLARARHLLEDTERPVSEICHAAGFNDLSHFERTFKKWYEVSPSRYRMRCAGERAAR
ncbi:helix-turn-helix domain-containing protein [Actinomadura sp. 3N407]|uniref:helix-turn-helix domain-containing protein n=1 Tax=Actinomadura sp. 3N407 TaxID=3457423 RepID=UPI003FCC80C6